MKKATFTVILADLVSLFLLIWGNDYLHWDDAYPMQWFVVLMGYLIAVLAYPPLAHIRLIRAEKVVARTITTTTILFALVAAYCYLKNDEAFHTGRMLFCYLMLTLAMMVDRFCARAFLKAIRTRDMNLTFVVFVGAGHNLQYLYQLMSRDLNTGYRVWGYFDDKPSELLPEKIPYLGKVEDAIPWLQDHNPHQLYCNLPSSRSEDILKIISFCDKHFIHFYSVPNVRNYVHRSMVVKMVDDMPVLTLREEPLNNAWNRFLKRTFDILVSGLFLITCFWWIYIIVAIITKITMPGPVFFFQKRNGILGREFHMIKFRSMKVNKEADTLQATKDDPRKTKWGNIMRKTSIDELPQFINVFRGDMSVVGPRPHMVKHTKEYSALIDKYMVRHWVKPGITGWAQVTGARGETEELWQMEERVQKDIWYIENWSLLLDLRIMWLTVYNVLGGEKGNAY